MIERARAAALAACALACLLLAACTTPAAGDAQRPDPHTACINDCSAELARCRIGCHPDTLFCLPGCERDASWCENNCPAAPPPAIPHD